MTKSVRIENADTSDHKLVAEVWDITSVDGSTKRLVESVNLDFPTAMATLTVWGTRYLVIREQKQT